MDHSDAYLIEFENAAGGSKTIEPHFARQEKDDSPDKGEKVMHNKEQQQQSVYFKHLGDVIKKYEQVILFDPTAAKTELFNILQKDHLFDKIKIETRQTDKMSENQQHAFVRAYFSTN